MDRVRILGSYARSSFLQPVAFFGEAVSRFIELDLEIIVEGNLFTLNEAAKSEVMGITESEKVAFKS